MKSVLQGLWPITGLITAILGVLLVFVLLRLYALTHRDGRSRYSAIRLIGAWLGIWIFIYIYLRDLVWDHYFHLRFDVFLGMGGILVLLLITITIITYLMGRHKSTAFLPSRVSLQYYLILTLSIFVFLGVILPQGFPSIPSRDVADLELSDLLSRSEQSLALWWAEVRRGTLSPGVIRISFDSEGDLDDILLRFVSQKGAGAAFVYQPDNFGEVTSTRLPLVVYPGSSTSRTIPEFTANELAHTLRMLDEKGILGVVNQSLNSYHQQTGEPTEWTSCLLMIGTIWSHNPELPDPLNLNISLTITRVIQKGESYRHYTLFTAYIDPENLNISELIEHDKIPNTWISG